MQNANDPIQELNHLQRYLVEEYVEDYQEGAMTRRQALKHIGAVLGSLAAANTLLAACVPAPAAAPALAQPSPVAEATEPPAAASTATAAPTATLTADAVDEATVVATVTVLATTETAPAPEAGPANATVAPDDPAIIVEDVSFPGDGLTVLGYLARPQGEGPFPAILVAHENRGLTPHIEDVTRRLAKAGYVGLAVDMLSSEGGIDKITNPDDIPGVLGGTPPDAMAGYFLSAIDYLETRPEVDATRLGMTGFCFGGGMTWLVATMAPELKAAVPFYGPHPPLDQVPNIQAAVLAMYGEDDTRINAGIPAIEPAMQQNGKTFEKIIYPGAGHAFHNDTGSRYNADAAADAWGKTLAWFEKYVKGM
jgi:carboxymethylenebutenolidase